MKKRFKEEQILEILREAETGSGKDEVLRKYGIGEITYYRWKRKYQGTNVKKIQRIRELEKENMRLKKMVAEYALANEAMKEFLKKKEWI